MPKSNRKGYFLMKLRNEGVGQQASTVATAPKGIRKQAKIAAKETRERKKLYINHLELRMKEMSEQLESTKKQNEQLKKELCNLKLEQQKKRQKQTKIKKYDDIPLQQNNPKARFQGLLKQIKNLSINLQNNNIQQVSRSLSVLRDKYGISGRQRLKFIEEQFDRICNIMMPMHYRLLMEHSTNNREFYSILGSHKHGRNLFKLGDREKQILINVRPQIMKQRQQYDKILSLMAELRAKVKTQNFKCQAIVDGIEDKVDPIFVGKLLLDLDFCRSKQNLEIIYPVSSWNKFKQQSLQLVTSNKKAESQNQPEQCLFRFEDDMEMINSLFS